MSGWAADFEQQRPQSFEIQPAEECQANISRDETIGEVNLGVDGYSYNPLLGCAIGNAFGTPAKVCQPGAADDLVLVG